MIKFTTLALTAALLTGCNAMKSGADGNSTALEASFNRPGFVAIENDGRLTVFRSDDPDLVAFQESGDLIKSVTRINAGPNGMTVRAPDGETIDAYTLSRAGFVTRVIDGRIWVFRDGSDDLIAFRKHGEPAKSVTRIGVGPSGETVRSSDAATIDAWLAAL